MTPEREQRLAELRKHMATITAHVPRDQWGPLEHEQEFFLALIDEMARENAELTNQISILAFDETVIPNARLGAALRSALGPLAADTSPATIARIARQITIGGHVERSWPVIAHALGHYAKSEVAPKYTAGALTVRDALAPLIKQAQEGK